MGDRNENSIAGESRSELQSPRFDEHAHLRARPVRPIPKSGVFFEKLFANGSKSLALIVVLGFLTGALIGVSLVKQNTSAPQETEQALVLTADNEALPLPDARVGAYGVQTDGTYFRTGAPRRVRVPNNGQPKAYRFAVIR